MSNKPQFDPLQRRIHKEIRSHTCLTPCPFLYATPEPYPWSVFFTIKANYSFSHLKNDYLYENQIGVNDELRPVKVWLGRFMKEVEVPEQKKEWMSH